MISVGTWEPPEQDWPKTDISGSYPGRGSSIKKERSDNTTLRWWWWWLQLKGLHFHQPHCCRIPTIKKQLFSSTSSLNIGLLTIKAPNPRLRGLTYPYLQMNEINYSLQKCRTQNQKMKKWGKSVWGTMNNIYHSCKMYNPHKTQKQNVMCLRELVPKAKAMAHAKPKG